MKAAILTELKKPLVIADIELPPKLDFGQVLVRIRASGICGAQINEIEGAKGPDKFLPHLLGHEGGGIVEEAGPGVSRVKKGDHVVLHWRKSPGIDSPTPKYKWGDKTVNAGWVTTFNDIAVISENRLTPVPEDLEFEVAALMGCAVTTGLGVINNNAQLRIGQSIAVFGAGGVGLNIIQGAVLTSADPIIAVDLYDNRLEMAKKFGATHTINSTKADPREEIRKIVGGGGCDITVDNTGNPRVIEAAYELTSAKGKTILVGVPKKGDHISIYSLPLHFEKVIKGSHGGDTNPAEDIPRYLNLYRKGKLNIKGLITNYYRFEEINEAISALRSGEVAGRCIINYD